MPGMQNCRVGDVAAAEVRVMRLGEIPAIGTDFQAGKTANQKEACSQATCPTLLLIVGASIFEESGALIPRAGT